MFNYGKAFASYALFVFDAFAYADAGEPRLGIILTVDEGSFGGAKHGTSLTVVDGGSLAVVASAPIVGPPGSPGVSSGGAAVPPGGGYFLLGASGGLIAPYSLSVGPTLGARIGSALAIVNGTGMDRVRLPRGALRFGFSEGSRDSFFWRGEGLIGPPCGPAGCGTYYGQVGRVDVHGGEGSDNGPPPAAETCGALPTTSSRTTEAASSTTSVPATSTVSTSSAAATSITSSTASRPSGSAGSVRGGRWRRWGSAVLMLLLIAQ